MAAAGHVFGNRPVLIKRQGSSRNQMLSTVFADVAFHPWTPSEISLNLVLTDFFQRQHRRLYRSLTRQYSIYDGQRQGIESIPSRGIDQVLNHERPRHHNRPTPERVDIILLATMSTRSFLQALSPALQRRIARTPLRRRFPASITSSTTFPQSTRHYASSSADTISSTPLQPVDGEIPAESADSPGLEKERKEQPRQASTSKVDQDELAEKRARPPKSSLAVLLSRLSLDYRQELEETLVICLTHYSFKGSKNAKGSKNVKHNESLASLGNHLLGLFTAEHLSRKFPLMPTEVLKGAVTAYVGPLACRSIARELGVTATSNTGEATALIPVRWANPKPSKRNSGSGLVQSGEQNSEMGEAEELEGQQSEELIVDGADGNEASLEGSERSRRTGRGRPQILDTRTKVIEQTVRAFVGMIFQEKVSAQNVSDDGTSC